MNTRGNKQTFPALFNDTGFQEISIEDIDQVFVDTFSTPRRKHLASHLRLFLQKLKSMGVTGEVWVNGSFSTKNPTPNDIDILLVTSETALSRLPIENLQELDQLTSIEGREYVRLRWYCDIYVAETSDIGRRKYYEELFSRNPDEHNRKGIPVIKL